MEEYFLDEWGELHKIQPKEAWADFEPWQYWRDEFDWIECAHDFEEQDIIAWRDDVIIRHRDNSKTFKNGVRLVIARVCNQIDDKLFLEVIHSEGETPLKKDDKIKRTLDWLAKYGVYRFPRAGETPYATTIGHAVDPEPSSIETKKAEFIENALELTLHKLSPRKPKKPGFEP